MEKINEFEENHDLIITDIFKDKELFLKRTQNRSLPICSVLDKNDKLLVINLFQELDNVNKAADLLQLQERLIHKLA